MIKIYTDGSCLNNGKKVNAFGGYGGIILNGKNVTEFHGGRLQATNNQMELRAIIEGIRLIKKPSDITIFSDSRYCVDSITKWLKNWIKTDFKKKKNIEMWKEYIDVSKKHNITAIWVEGHNGDIYNERADDLATSQSKKMKRITEGNVTVKTNINQTFVNKIK